MDRLLRTGALAALLFCGMGTAHAACRPADLVGTWDVYLTVSNARVLVGWFRCTVRIPASGLIQRTACAGNDRERAAINGALTLNGGCRVGGRLSLISASERVPFTVEATMTRSRDLIVGAITERPSRVALSLQAVKL